MIAVAVETVVVLTVVGAGISGIATGNDMELNKETDESIKNERTWTKQQNLPFPAPLSSTCSILSLESKHSRGESADASADLIIDAIIFSSFYSFEMKQLSFAISFGE